MHGCASFSSGAIYDHEPPNGWHPWAVAQVYDVVGVSIIKKTYKAAGESQLFFMRECGLPAACSRIIFGLHVYGNIAYNHECLLTMFKSVAVLLEQRKQTPYTEDSRAHISYVSQQPKSEHDVCPFLRG